MIVIHLLVLSICMGIMLLSIHHSDEIHRLVAWLSGMIALVCVFVLTPLLIKGLLGLVFFLLGHKVFPTKALDN
ncbi:MAG: hypothetical protein ACFCU5_04740 [Pleurocapsa sp.]